MSRMDYANFNLSDRAFERFLSPPLQEFILGSRATYEVCDVRFANSVAVLVGAEQWQKVPYQVLLPHAQSRFDFDKPQFLKGDRIVTGDFSGYRQNSSPFYNQLFLGAVKGSDNLPPGFPRAAINPQGYLNPTHIGDWMLTKVVEDAPRSSTPIRGRVRSNNNTSIDVEGDGLLMPARVEERLVRGSLGQLRPDDSVDLHVTYVPRGTLVDRRFIYVAKPAWDVQGMMRTTASRTPIVNWVEPTAETKRRQQERREMAHVRSTSRQPSPAVIVPKREAREMSPPRKRTYRYWEEHSPERKRRF